MSNNKTPSYKIKAMRDYQKRHVRKNILLHSDNDEDIINAINADATPFATTVKSALRQYYKIKKA